MMKIQCAMAGIHNPSMSI